MYVLEDVYSKIGFCVGTCVAEVQSERTRGLYVDAIVISNSTWS